MLISPGLVGPKPRPKGVGDGQQVDIPVPPMNVEQRSAREGRLTAVMVVCGQACSLRVRRDVEPLFRRSN